MPAVLFFGPEHARAFRELPQARLRPSAGPSDSRQPTNARLYLKSPASSRSKHNNAAPASGAALILVFNGIVAYVAAENSGIDVASIDPGCGRRAFAIRAPSAGLPWYFVLF